MGLLRSTFYDAPSVAVDDTEIVRRMQAICERVRDVWVPARRCCAAPGRARRQQQEGASVDA